MNSKIFVISVIIILILSVLAWYIITKIEPPIEQSQQLQGNQSLIDDTVDDISSDLNKIPDDSAAQAELDNLDAQTQNF